MLVVVFRSIDWVVGRKRMILTIGCVTTAICLPSQFRQIDFQRGAHCRTEVTRLPILPLCSSWLVGIYRHLQQTSILSTTDPMFDASIQPGRP